MSIPWSKIRAEWVKGGITQKQLAEKYGVNLKTLQNRASNEGWKNLKGKIKEKAEDQLCARVAQARVTHLEKLIQANEDLLDGLAAIAALWKEHPNRMIRDKAGTIKNAESFAKALQTAAMTQRDLYRLPNIDQRFAQKKWREQMKLEKEKLAKDNGSAEEQLIWVVHEPPEEEAADG